jgi:hypothetical protein
MDSTLKILVQLEIHLHKVNSRHDEAWLQKTLHPSFREFGRSGRIHDRDSTIATLLAEESNQVIWAQDFAVQWLDEQAALLTYRSAIETQGDELELHANRSSIWLQTESGWQIVFHQGTPTERFPKALPDASLN